MALGFPPLRSEPTPFQFQPIDYNNDCTMKLRITYWAGFLAIFIMLLSPARGEDLTQGWAFIDPGTLPKKEPYGPQGIPIFIQGLEAGGVVDAQSTPAQPFPEGSRALYITPEETSGWVRIRMRPFEDFIPAKGFFEFQFHMLEGNVRLNISGIPVPWNPADDWAYIEKNGIFPIRIAVGEGMQCGSPDSVGTETNPFIQAGENYTLRLQWNKEADFFIFTFLLNGEPVLGPDGEPHKVKIAADKMNEPLGFTLQTGMSGSPTGKLFLGRVEAGLAGD